MQKRDTVSISGLRRSPGVGNGNLFKYSCLENSKDKGSWWATVHVVAKSWTWACVCVCTQSHTHTHTHTDVGKKEGEVTWSCLTRCYPVDCILPGSSVQGISQARILEWAAISFTRVFSRIEPTSLHYRQTLYRLSHQESLRRYRCMGKRRKWTQKTVRTYRKKELLEEIWGDLR